MHSITLTHAHARTHTPQVGPIVQYYQCDIARNFLIDQIKLSPSLAAIAAFESTMVTADVNDVKWADAVLKTVAEDSL